MNSTPWIGALSSASLQCRSKIGRGVPRTAIAPTTSSQNGSTPKPGIASRASPGNSSHCRPSTMNSSNAVPRSTIHVIGGKGAAKAPIASEMPAMAKARASRFLENLIAALIGCLLGSIGGVVIWIWSTVIGNSFAPPDRNVARSATERSQMPLQGPHSKILDGLSL
jgi:hypothetical protein